MNSLKSKQMQLDDLMPIIRETLAEGKTVTFSPMGISMLPMLRQGVDTVTLSPLPEKLKKYDLPLYRRDNGQYVLHRVTDVGETYTCMGDNQFVPEPGLRQEQMIALVTAFTRGEKAYRVESLPYKAYCRVWHHTRFFRHVWRRIKNKLRRCLG